MENEIWKDVLGQEGRYQISNFGRVKSLKRIYIKKERILNPHVDFHGYCCVVMRTNGVNKKYKVHRLVALHFIPPIENKPQTNHLDGNKLNNHVENLEWCNNQENILHSFRVLGREGTWQGKKGKDNYSSKAVLQFDRKNNFIRRYPSGQEAADGIKGCFQLVSLACLGKIKTAKGFILKFEKDYINEQENYVLRSVV